MSASSPSSALSSPSHRRVDADPAARRSNIPVPIIQLDAFVHITPEVFKKLTLQQLCLEILHRNIDSITADQVQSITNPNLFVRILRNLPPSELADFQERKGRGKDLNVERLWKKHVFEEFGEKPKTRATWQLTYLHLQKKERDESERARQRNLKKPPSRPAVVMLVDPALSRPSTSTPSKVKTVVVRQDIAQSRKRTQPSPRSTSVQLAALLKKTRR